MWRKYLLLCVLNPLPNNCIRCSLVLGLWAEVANHSRLALLWLNMIAKLNLPHISSLPSFTDPLQGPFLVWAQPWALMFPALPLLGRKKSSRTAWYPRYDLRWRNTVWKNAGILVLSFPFQILQPFWFLMVMTCYFHRTMQTALHRISQYPVVLHSSLEMFSQHP